MLSVSKKCGKFSNQVTVLIALSKQSPKFIPTVFFFVALPTITNGGVETKLERLMMIENHVFTPVPGPRGGGLKYKKGGDTRREFLN